MSLSDVHALDKLAPGEHPMQRKHFIRTLFGLAMAGAGLAAQAQEKPLEWVVGYPAGGGSDFLARTIGQPYRRVLSAALLDAGYLTDTDAAQPRPYIEVLHDAIDAVSRRDRVSLLRDGHAEVPRDAPAADRRPHGSGTQPVPRRAAPCRGDHP